MTPDQTKAYERIVDNPHEGNPVMVYPVSPALREHRMEAGGINQLEFIVITNYGDPVNPSISHRPMTMDEVKDLSRKQAKQISELEAKLEVYEEISELKARLKELE